MSTTVAPASTDALNSDYWRAHRDQLFIASCIALIVTAMSFAIRGDLIGPLCQRFNLTGNEIGWVVGTAFWGFTLAMIIGGPLCDVLGMGTLLAIAFVGHAVGIAMTIFASGFYSLFFSTLIFGMANGFVEAACNPLLATLYPDQKINRLNKFHTWFPGGIVIGGLVAYAITSLKLGMPSTPGGVDHSWQIKMATMLIPLVIYGFLFFGKKFPATERAASGISTSAMFSSALNPFFLLFVVCMLMTAVTELGPQQWFPNILTRTAHVSGILILVWITGLMALARSFLAGPVEKRLSPIPMLIVSSILGAIGLYTLSIAASAPMAVLGATVFAMGVCFFWPTMLGTVSERFPKTGALGLAIMGGAGMLATSFAQPVIGGTRDSVATDAALASRSINPEQVKNTWMYRSVDFKDTKAFGQSIRDGKSGVSQFLREKLPGADVDAAMTGAPGADQKLAEDMNGILSAGAIYDKQRFSQVTLPEDIQHQADTTKSGAELPAVNRAVLDRAYAEEITPSNDTARLPNAALEEGGRAAIRQVVILPIVLTLAFVGIFLFDKSRGGYRKEVLVQEQAERV